MNPYMYLLVRNDLPSMNPGKAVAHGAHGATKAVWDMTRRYKENAPIMTLLDEWHGDRGFGTKITLSASLVECEAAVMVAKALGFPAEMVVDPTYPYIVDREMAALITHSEEHPPQPIKGGKMLCFREETTAAYVFGPKDDLRPVVGKFPLMD